MTAKFEILDEESDCVCCPMRDICTIEPGIDITVTKDMMRRSACSGGFIDAWEETAHPSTKGGAR